VQSKSSQTFKAVRIYNLQGQLVLEQTFTKPVLETEISLPNLPKGVYQTIIDATETQRENIPLLFLLKVSGVFRLKSGLSLFVG
jgi:hypothetical protein